MYLKKMVDSTFKFSLQIRLTHIVWQVLGIVVSPSMKSIEQSNIQSLQMINIVYYYSYSYSYSNALDSLQSVHPNET